MQIIQFNHKTVANLLKKSAEEWWDDDKDAYIRFTDGSVVCIHAIKPSWQAYLSLEKRSDEAEINGQSFSDNQSTLLSFHTDGDTPTPSCRGRCLLSLTTFTIILVTIRRLSPVSTFQWLSSTTTKREKKLPITIKEIYAPILGFGWENLPNRYVQREYLLVEDGLVTSPSGTVVGTGTLPGGKLRLLGDKGQVCAQRWTGQDEMLVVDPFDNRVFTVPSVEDLKCNAREMLSAHINVADAKPMDLSIMWTDNIAGECGFDVADIPEPDELRYTYRLTVWPCLVWSMMGTITWLCLVRLPCASAALQVGRQVCVPRLPKEEHAWSAE